MDPRVLPLPPDAGQQGLQLFNAPAQPVLALGAREDGKTERRQGLKRIFLSPQP